MVSQTNSVNLSWDQPTKPSRCPVLGYQVQYTYENCSNGNEMKKCEPDVTDPVIQVTGLQPYWNYTFTIGAYMTEDKDVGSSESMQDVQTLEDGIFYSVL